MMTPDDIKQAVSQVTAGKANLIDVRRDDERAQIGAAAGATNFPIENMMAGDIPQLDKSLPTYIFCRSGGRAGRAKSILQQHGYTDVHNLGGFGDWQSSGGPVTRQ